MIFNRLLKPIIGNQADYRRLIFIATWTAVFTLAYAQSPLFTSNQNQYFIHGMAEAGYGYLKDDWLAGTLDPTPVFSWLVAVTYRLIPWLPVYYLLFTLLAGVYLFSLFGILAKAIPLDVGNDVGNRKRWFYLLALVLLHSAALRYLIVRVFDQDWVYLFDGGVAGQRLLGSVLQPSAFGVFLLMSIMLYLQGKLTGAVIGLITAGTFHPTYLLSAGILTLVFMGLEFHREKRPDRALAIGVGALLGVAPVLITTAHTFGGTDPVLAARSRELLVSFRIPHHAIPAVWFDVPVILKTASILLALALVRKTRLFHILLWPTVIAMVGTMVQILSGSDVLALLFPWRVSTWLVPISTGVILFWGLERLWPRLNPLLPKRGFLTLTISAAIILAGMGLVKSAWEQRERNTSTDRPIMAHINNTKQPGQVYLIPLDMQDFRLETGAPAYVEFKSIPYKDTDVLEWYRRVSLAGRLYRAPYKRSGCQIVSALAQEGVTHVILPYDHALQKCDNLKRGYWDWNYVLYQVRDSNK